MLFDHRVGAREPRWWDVEAKRLDGLKIGTQLELDRALHRKLGRFLAAKNAIDVRPGAAVQVDSVNAIKMPSRLSVT
jgi:hypothetical protein